MGLVVAFAAAFAAVLLLTPLARRASFALGVLDHPGPLKVQREPVAYLGGAAVFGALAAVLAPWHPSWIVPLALAAGLGLADDIRTISARSRLVMQCSVGAVAAMVAPAPGAAGWAVTAVLVVVLVNAVNLIDGMDGLASTVVAICAVGFAVVGGKPALPAVAVCGALVGFLAFNRPPARIYLGDAGSYLLGTVLALLGATALHGRPHAVWVALPLFVALPLADTAIAVLRRWRNRRPLFAGDRSHVYDQLADRGWPIVRVLAACAAVQLAATAAGLVSWHLGAVGAPAVTGAFVVIAAVTVWKTGFVAERATT